MIMKMEEKTILKIGLGISFLGLLIILLMGEAQTETTEKNITINFCSIREGNTYLFYSEEKESKAVFKGEFPCRKNQKLSIAGEETGGWFNIDSIKVID